MLHQLNKDELEQFQELGFVGPFQLIEPQEVDDITKELVAEKSKFFFMNRVISRVPGFKHKLRVARWGKAKWHKGMHAVSPKLYKLATQPAITDKVASLIGNDVILWGSLVLTIKPNDNPSWHMDMECKDWDLFEGASVWLALSNVDENSCMRVITRSHHLSITPEELRKTAGLDVFDHASVLQAAQRFDPQCECVSVNTKPGEFFIFARHLWHTGQKSSKVRNSLLLQYSRPSTNVRIPATFSPPVTWDSRPVPCVVVRGETKSSIAQSVNDKKVLVKAPG